MNRQDSLHDQLRDLIQLANKHGMYDAADFIKNIIEVDSIPGNSVLNKKDK